MAETGPQSDCRSSQNDLSNVDVMIGIKKELEVLVKPEPHECVVCVERTRDTFDIYSTNTVGSGATLHSFLCKFTNSSLNYESNCSKYICKSCLDLINVFEQAEIEYMKLKEAFESIISKNPLFDASNIQPIKLTDVKNEFLQVHMSTTEEHDNFGDFGVDSEDEPLSLTKKKRHKTKPEKRKKNKTHTKATGKRKTKAKQLVESDSWECNDCGLHEETGGSVAETAHKISVHGLAHDENSSAISEVKKEEHNDSMQSLNNGFDTTPKVEIDYEEDVDDDSSSIYMPEDEAPKTKKRVGKILKSAIDKATRKRERIIHKCDQCDAKYSSLVRLEQHKLKHDGSKPPYICEVCGAHYKHKRACDIHIALHKGISDWKCEECNKLFPSKGALARHNNIHTGKLNYQCDLCGKSFIHTSSFKMHKLSHSGLKPHACDVCGLALMTRSHLKRHKRVHSGEKRHECSICGKRFSERYNLAAHAKSHESGAGAVPPQPRRHLFRCTFCPDRFERRYMLERHMSVTHGRALERPPPTPRNTMSKLLKAQARRQPEEPKDERSSDSRSTPVTTQKLIAQLSSSGPALGAASSWSSAYTEFNLRADFPH